MHVTRRLLLGAVAIAAASAAAGQSVQPVQSAAAAPLPESAAPVLWQPSMNVFRRFEVPAEKMFEFYGQVLGFQQLSTINLGTGAGVARFQAGAQELKLTRRVGDRQYRPGGVDAATGLRLLTFHFADEQALARRFAEHGYPPPQFAPTAGTNRRSALVTDPDGQAVELVVIPNASAAELAAIEVGLTVADVEKSRAFYRGFVGLEELPPAADSRFGVAKYSYRHGATTISLRSFGKSLPADTGSGGIQYVVSNVDVVAALADARHVVVDQPLSTLGNFALRTIWLDDPDGITNYFAETAASRQARTAR
jgi:catechol-2,3-dioxygenase